MTDAIKLTLLFIGIIAIFVVCSCFYQIGENEAVLLTRFESPVALDTAPGLHTKCPWPIDRVTRFDLRTRSYTSPLMEIPIADGRNYIVRSFVHWTIGDPERFRNRIGMSADDAHARLSAMVQDAMRTHVNRMLNHTSLPLTEDQFAVSLRQRAIDDFGIAVKTAGFDRFELPPSATRAIFARQKTEYEQQEAVVLAETSGKAAAIVENARAVKGETIAKATAEAAKIRGAAENEALKYLGVYQQEPALAALLRRLETAEKAFSSKTTIITDIGMPEFRDLADSPMERIQR